MKLTILLLAALTAGAAPITFTTTGNMTPITDGYFVALLPGQTPATFTASQQIDGISFYVDTAPHGVGSGVKFFLDGVLVLNTGLGNLVQQTLAFVALQPFTIVRLETNETTGWAERLTITGIELSAREIEASSVPEPSTATILLAVLIVAAAAGVWRGER